MGSFPGWCLVDYSSFFNVTNMQTVPIYSYWHRFPATEGQTWDAGAWQYHDGPIVLYVNQSHSFKKKMGGQVLFKGNEYRFLRLEDIFRYSHEFRLISGLLVKVVFLRIWQQTNLSVIFTWWPQTFYAFIHITILFLLLSTFVTMAFTEDPTSIHHID